MRRTKSKGICPSPHSPGRSGSGFRCSGICRCIQLKNQRENTISFGHVVAIFVAKGFQHHLFFSCNPAEEQKSKTHKSCKSREPVRQQTGLGNRPEPKRGVHWMSNVPIDAGSDELMVF